MSENTLDLSAYFERVRGFSVAELVEEILRIMDTTCLAIFNKLMLVLTARGDDVAARAFDLMRGRPYLPYTVLSSYYIDVLLGHEIQLDLSGADPARVPETVFKVLKYYNVEHLLPSNQ